MTIEDDLKAAFLESYERTGRELGYWGRRFKRSLEKDGARSTAKRLLKPRGASSVTDGLLTINDRSHFATGCIGANVGREPNIVS